MFTIPVADFIDSQHQLFHVKNVSAIFYGSLPKLYMI